MVGGIFPSSPSLMACIPRAAMLCCSSLPALQPRAHPSLARAHSTPKPEQGAVTPALVLGSGTGWWLLSKCPPVQFSEVPVSFASGMSLCQGSAVKGREQGGGAEDHERACDRG